MNSRVHNEASTNRTTGHAWHLDKAKLANLWGPIGRGLISYNQCMRHLLLLGSQLDGTLVCSVNFSIFSLLDQRRLNEEQINFSVNNLQLNLSNKLIDELTPHGY